MTTYLFHGLGKLGMLNKISSIRQGFDPENISEISSKDKSWNEVQMELNSTSLFSGSRLYILEDFLEADLTNISGELTIILKFSKTIPSNSTIYKRLPKNITIISFDEAKETSIFPLLDFLAEKNPKALAELESHLNEWGGQYVLTMISYGLRRFILPSPNLQPFAAKKIEAQRTNLPQEKINNLYRETLLTDFKIKQGLTEEKIALYLLAQKFI